MESDKLSVNSVRNSGGSHRLSGHDFHGHELLLLRKLQSDAELYCVWEEKLQKKILDGNYDIGEIPYTLWYLTVTLDRKEKRFLNFFRERINQFKDSSTLHRRETLLSSYLDSHYFTELHLDGIYKYGDDNSLPIEIFKCRSVRWLSMKYNYLDRIPPDVGRMSNLECLSLTNNKLQTRSIPYSLTFCSRLKHLLLDNNLLDALPGYLLNMASLETVHRHGNHNYFKSTFMWYHTDVNERILPVSGCSDHSLPKPESLQFWAAKALIGSKTNFFTSPHVPSLLKDYISSVYGYVNVCGYCNTAKLASRQGYKVITFKNPYLGNTCVPFQHWACSLTCAMAIEIPAREEQITAARELDKQYDAYIDECQKQYMTHSAGTRLSLRRRPRRSEHTLSWRTDSQTLPTQPPPRPPAMTWDESPLDNHSFSSSTLSLSPSRNSTISQQSASCVDTRHCGCTVS